MECIIHHIIQVFIERVTGSDSANITFYTLIYGLFYGESIDFGTIFWSQFTQSARSNSKDSEISCVRFWSIVVSHALNHYHVPEMKDCVIVVIPRMETTTLSTYDPKNFDFVGSILEVMLARVPSDNDIIKVYKELVTARNSRYRYIYDFWVF